MTLRVSGTTGTRFRQVRGGRGRDYLEVSEVRNRNNDRGKSDEYCDCDAARFLLLTMRRTGGDNAFLIATDKCDTGGRR